ncbi:MAG: hypothetical protein HOC71_15890 [Candidatus Latescibacteria bacterium]|jgi:peptidoglycan hydrolase FlgJ|nr:hypothetical protein [Candidatus Latescibacterota bacterium]
MEFYSIGNTEPRMIKIQNRQRSFMPLKPEKEALPVEKTDPGNSVEARKMKLRKAARGFEAIFIRQLLSIMRSTTSDGGMFGKGSVGEIYGDMMDNALAETLSERSILGLSDSLYRQLAGKEEKAGDVNLDAK